MNACTRAIDSQLEAARARLRRELGRTLRCIGNGDLSLLLAQQAARENRADGRYRRAQRLLGTQPAWSDDEKTEIEEYVGNLTENERKARVAGSEIDAALNDPRWRAAIGRIDRGD